MKPREENMSTRSIQGILFIQNLADILDLHIGVEARKEILEGNERLTLATDERTWVAYVSEVMKKLNASIGEDKKTEILAPISYFASDF